MGRSERRRGSDADVSITSTSSTNSENQGFETSGKPKKKAALSLSMNSNINNNTKSEKKWKKNKITKDDFFNKTTQFRTWLEDQKGMLLDELPNAKARELFKKFVKKWNSKKLHDKFYVDADPIWAMASPDAYDRSTIPEAVPATPPSHHRSMNLSELDLPDGKFSTFGKVGGRRIKSMMDRFDSEGGLNWATQSLRLPPSRNKSRPLAEIFPNSTDDISPTTRSMTKTSHLEHSSFTSSTRSLKVPLPPLINTESIYGSLSRRSSMSSDLEYMAFGPVLQQRRIDSQSSINSDASYVTLTNFRGSQNIPPVPPMRGDSILSVDNVGVGTRASWAAKSGYHSNMTTPVPSNSDGHYMAIGSRLSQQLGFDGTRSLRSSCRGPPPPPRRISMQSLTDSVYDTSSCSRYSVNSIPAQVVEEEGDYVFIRPAPRVKTRASLSDSALCTMKKEKLSDTMLRATSDSCFAPPSKPAPTSVGSRRRPMSFSAADFDGRGTMRIRARAWTNSLRSRIESLAPPHSPSRKVRESEGIEIVSKPADPCRASIRRKDSYAAALREKANQLCRKRVASEKVRKTAPAKLLRRSSSTRVQPQIPCYV